ncbi:GNAT superfamily N-acetyltransferase [Pelomonas saccharophila]|uniref:GNAT superfamily N-acetyltransferase n=1 Tax=Roseateles saccharophilus TaxID=304 RepID=A0ABU1YMA1_ROSSA|nr:GNAT family N-acetyltransferase [Roseateles saccharophilus]MDR7269989.1 GNAT superfamily N-acetyltransferase [Roseateles saccharophilus]
MIDIRLLQPSDSLEALTALLHTAYASLADQGWNFTAVDQSVDVTRERLAGAQGFVAEWGGRLVGTVAVRGPKPAGEAYIADPPPPLYTTPGTAILSQLAVHPDCRGLGLGEQLMDVAEAWAREQGFRQLALDTAEPATALRNRYARRGYAEVGGVQWQGKTYASVLMCKPLG